LSELPREAAPARDLWPAIADRLNRESSLDAASAAQLTITGLPQRPPGRWSARATWWWHPKLAAAFIFACLLAAAALGWILSRGPISEGQTAVVQVTDASQYLKERPALMRSLNGQLASLPPASRRKVLDDFAVIERSIDDVRSALGRDPGNALLRALLVESYQDEEHLLLTVQDASIWTRKAGAEQGRT
jgi:hypothetical protein